MRLAALAGMLLASMSWLSNSRQDPATPVAPDARAQDEARPTWKILAPAPQLESCEWLQGTTGSGAGKVVKKVGGDGSGDLPFDPKDIEKLASSIGAPDIAKLHGSVVVVHTFDSRDNDMISSGLKMLRELSVATADRDVKFVGLVAADDGESAKRVMSYVGLETPLGAVSKGHRYFDPTQNGPRAAFVVGRSGELEWRGDLVADAKGFCAAMKLAVERHAAPALDHEFAPELDGVLLDYFNGRFDRAREAAKKMRAKFGTAEDEPSKTLARDADQLVQSIDIHERDLVQRAHQAAAAQRVDVLVDLDSVLQLGFGKPTADVARDALKEIDNKTLKAGASKDARDWLELERERPLFFPARNDAEGKKFAKKVDAFLKSTPNSTPPTQRAKKLLEAFQRLP